MRSSILKRLLQRGSNRSVRDRREAKRLFPGRPTPCVLVLRATGERQEARLHNLSFRGAGVLTTRPFPPGTAAEFLLVNSAHTYALSLTFTVVHCSCTPGQEYIVGGRFDRELQLEELLPFMV